MKQRRGVTLAELLLTVAVLAAALIFLVYAMTGGRSENWRVRCRRNLSQLAMGVSIYLNQYHVDNIYPWPVGYPGCGTKERPDFGGAEWLAVLYWTNALSDPGVYICPSTADTNADGRDLGEFGCSGPGFQGGPDGKLKPDAVSYAAMGSTSFQVYLREKPGKPPERDPPYYYEILRDAPMACDDTEGTVNHPAGLWRRSGMNVLFFDSHVEFWDADKADIQRAVGLKGGPLFHLRN